MLLFQNDQREQLTSLTTNANWPIVKINNTIRTAGKLEDGMGFRP